MHDDTPIIELDVNDFKDESPEVETDTTESESSADETKEETPAEETETPEGEETEDSETEDSTKEDATDETDDQPKKGAEERKADLNNEIRTLVARRNELRDTISARNAEAYKPQTATELEAEGMDPALARVEALEQQMKMRDYNAYVSDLNASIGTESLQVMADFPIFDPESSAYDSALAKRAGDLYKSVAKIQVDPKTGLTIRANVLPYDIYKAFAETASSGARRGEVKGQRAAEKMLAEAETPVSGGEITKTPKKDPFLTGLTKNLNS